MKIEEIQEIANSVLEAENLFPVELKLNKDNVIELFIDSLTGVNIETCIEVSRRIEARLDREKEDFELTVSSAGIGCPFKVEGQYRKNLGKKVEIRLHDGSRLEGILKDFDEKEVVLVCEEKRAVEGKKKKEIVSCEKCIAREDFKEIKDVIVF